MAFDLVAKLKLQDEFSDKLKSVFAQLDKLKGQVKQAAIGTSDMGAKFTTAGTKMSAALQKVETKTVALPKKFESFGNMANRSLEAVSKGADTFGTSTDKAARLSQSSLKILSDRANEAANKMQEVGEKSKSGFTKSSKAIEGTKKVMKSMTTDSTASLKLMTSGTNKVIQTFKKLGDGGKRAIGMVDKKLFGIPSKMGGFVSKMRSGFANGINKPASTAKNAIMGIASAVGVVAIASKGFNMLKGAIEGAVARYDTLNAFPKVMEKIGFSTDESTKSIQRLAEGIDGLPTTLGEVADTAQRIAVMTKDLDGATETTLALNNAFLASGADAEKAARGTEQYIKMIATGTVGMDSWTTLQETMGLALNDLAEAFGYTGKSAQNDLYKALKEGDVTFDQFNKKLVELSKKTGGFAETALDGSGGIATAWKNIRTAITNGVAGSITAIDKALGGTGEIEEIIKKIKPVISQTFKDANAKLETFAKQMKKIYDATKPIHPVLKDIAKAALIFGGVLGGMAVAAGTIAGMGAFFALIGSGVGIAILAVAGLVTGFVLAYQKIEPFRNAVQNLLGTFKDVFNVLKSGSGGGDLMKKMGFSEEQIQVARDFVDSVANAFDQLKSKFFEVVEQISPKFGTLTETFSLVKDTLIAVFDSLWSFLSPIFTALGVAIGVIGDIAIIAFNNVIIPAVQWLGIAFSVMWKLVGPILKLLAELIKVAFTMIKVMWDNILKPFVEYMSKHFVAMLDESGKWLKKLGDGFDGVGVWISKATDMAKTFGEILGNIKIPDWIMTIGGKLKSAANWAGNIAFGSGPGVQDSGGGEGRYNGIKYVPRDGYCIAA